MGLKVGDKAPELLGVNENGEEIRLSSYKGKKVVLYFYPKAVSYTHLLYMERELPLSVLDPNFHP